MQDLTFFSKIPPIPLFLVITEKPFRVQWTQDQSEWDKEYKKYLATKMLKTKLFIPIYSEKAFQDIQKHYNE